MKKNPVIPYAIIAVIGILAVIIISVVGIDQRQAIQDAEENGGEETEQSEEGGGETAGGDGDAVFQNNCAMCHGSDLASGSAPALTEIGSKYSQEELAQIVQEGIGNMPAQPQVQGEDLEALTQWLSEKQ